MLNDPPDSPSISESKDVRIFMGENPPILCPYNILVSESKYFKMCLIDYPQGLTEPFTLSLDESLLEYQGVVIAIQYLIEKKDILNTTNINSVLLAANYLQIEELLELCEEYIKQRVDMSNCINIYRFIKMLNVPELRDYIERKFITPVLEKWKAHLIRLKHPTFTIKMEDLIFEGSSCMLGQSEYFYDLAKITNEIDITDHIDLENDAQGFFNLIDWALDQALPVNADSLLEVLRMAKKFKYTEIVADFVEMWEKVDHPMDCTNWGDIYKRVNEMKHKKIRLLMILKLLRNFNEVQEEAAEVLNFNDMKEILRNDCIMVDEELDVLKFVISWYKKYPEVRSKQVLHLLKLIRFNLIPKKNLKSFIKTHKCVASAINSGYSLKSERKWPQILMTVPEPHFWNHYVMLVNEACYRPLNDTFGWFFDLSRASWHTLFKTPKLKVEDYSSCYFNGKLTFLKAGHSIKNTQLTQNGTLVLLLRHFVIEYDIESKKWTNLYSPKSRLAKNSMVLPPTLMLLPRKEGEELMAVPALGFDSTSFSADSPPLISFEKRRKRWKTWTMVDPYDSSLRFFPGQTEPAQFVDLGNSVKYYLRFPCGLTESNRISVFRVKNEETLSDHRSFSHFDYDYAALELEEFYITDWNVRSTFAGYKNEQGSEILVSVGGIEVINGNKQIASKNVSLYIRVEKGSRWEMARISDMNISRIHPGVVVDGKSGLIFVFGGYNVICDKKSKPPLNSLEIYSTKTKKWTLYDSDSHPKFPFSHVKLYLGSAPIFHVLKYHWEATKTEYKKVSK